MCKEKVEKLTVINVCTELKKITNLFICIPPIVLFEMVYRIHKKKTKNIVVVVHANAQVLMSLYSFNEKECKKKIKQFVFRLSSDAEMSLFVCVWSLFCFVLYSVCVYGFCIFCFWFFVFCFCEPVARPATRLFLTNFIQTRLFLRQNYQDPG